MHNLNLIFGLLQHNMDKENQHFRHIRKEKNATKTAYKICNIYGASSVTVRVVQKWFALFKNGDSEVDDRECSGRPVTTDTATITAVVDQNPHFTLRAVDDVVEVSHI